MIHLLIADDEAPIREGLRSLDWQSENVQVAGVVDNGMEALELLQSEMIDVVLTDIRMPALDGLEIAKFVHEQEMYTEVILLSGYSDFAYAKSAIQYGVMEYLLKPSSPEEIFASVRRASQQIDKKRERDIRVKLMEAELGRRQLLMNEDGVVLGDMENSQLCKQLLAYLAAHYAEPITLSSLSREFHFSTTYLSKLLKRATGYTFLETLNAVRIHTAAERLRTGDESFSFICARIGIEDPRYFSQVFRKYFGVTPSAYRKAPCVPLDAKLTLLVKSVMGAEA